MNWLRCSGRRAGHLLRATAPVALLLLSASGSAAGLSGVVTCGDCIGAGVLVLSAADGAPVVAVSVPGAGHWQTEVPDGLTVDIVAFRDDDLDLWPDLLAGEVPYAGNPVVLGSATVGGVDMALPLLGGTIDLAGTLTCVDCGVVLVVAVTPPGLEGGQLVAADVLGGPGPFHLAVPADVGPLHLLAFRDGDLDGAPDPGTEAAAYAGNPIAVGDSAIAGLDLTLPGLGGPDRVVAGTVSCGGCSEALTVLATAGPLPDAAVLSGRLLPGPGPFTLTVDGTLGTVHVFAYVDADGDGAPDGNAAPTGADQNPVALGPAGAAGITVAIPPPPGSVSISGTVACGDCAGALGVLATGAGGPLALTLLSAPGPWVLQLPAGAGPVSFAAFRDLDQDGAPDSDVPLAPWSENPLTIAMANVGGVELTLPPQPVDETVALTGTVTCAGCPGGALVRIAAWTGDGSGAVLGLAVLPTPGAWAATVPAGVGAVAISAGRDDDGDGAVDGGMASYAGNPVAVDAAPVSGLDITLTAPTPDVLVTGMVTCAQCSGVRVLALGPPGLDGGPPLATYWRPGGGPFVLALSPEPGSVFLAAYRDDDADGTPDAEGTVAPWSGNPLVLAEDPVAGLTLDLDGAPPDADPGGPQAEASPELEAVEPVSVEPGPVEPDPVEPDPVEPDFVEPDPVEPDPVEPDPVEPDFVEPDPVEPSPMVEVGETVDAGEAEEVAAAETDPAEDAGPAAAETGPGDDPNAATAEPAPGADAGPVTVEPNVEPDSDHASADPGAAGGAPAASATASGDGGCRAAPGPGGADAARALLLLLLLLVARRAASSRAHLPGGRTP